MVESSIVAKYSFYGVLNPIDFCWKTNCLLAGIGKGGCSRLVVVISLGSSPTVEMENRAKRLQPNINSPLSVYGPVSAPKGFTKCQITHDRNCISLRYLIRNINEQH